MRKWLLYCFTFGVLTSLLLSSNVNGKEYETCNTSYCKEVAIAIQQNRNLSVNPCDNYYEYACGSWSIHNPLPDHELLWTAQHIVQQKVYMAIRDLLQEDIQEGDIAPVRAVKKLYRSCLDIANVEDSNIQYIQSILNITRGWPMSMPFNDWDPNGVAWQQIDQYYMQMFGVSPFFKLGYEIDEKNKDQFILVIMPNAELPLYGKINIQDVWDPDSPYMNGIYSIVSFLADREGRTLEVNQLSTDITDLVTFELDLINITLTELTDSSTSDAERMTLREFDKWYNNLQHGKTSQISFVRIIKQVFRMVNITVNEDEEILVYKKKFFLNLAKYFDTIPNRVIVNFLQWFMMYSLLSYISQDFRNTKFNMLYADLNVTGYPPRWLSCLTDVKLKDAVSYMYVKRYASDDVTEAAENMTQSIQDELKSRISGVKELPQNFKDYVKDKLENIHKEIGFPEWYKNDTEVEEQYHGLELNSGYLDDVIRYITYEFKRDLKKLRRKGIKPKWLEQVTLANAFYTPQLNTILIPTSELQPPLFTPSLPDAITYGTVGFIIGHELAHSIDSDGIYYNKDGTLVSWADNVKNAYHNQTECFRTQYSQYHRKYENGTTVPLSGNMTYDENLSDNLGLQVSYNVYKKVQNDRGHEVRLAGLESVSEDELFFLSFANVWCSKVKNEYVEYRTSLDIHSPEPFRVIGSVSNMQQFADAYKCPVGTYMNPKQKCVL